ncbi:MAG: HAMP domain-containing histidine kinase [Ruminococcaceae bacterium]|nr:HAMP domain-containing histidine kinase [Oscillospiraceae bacterium]
MKQEKFTPFLVIFILLAVVVAFAFSYNASVTTAVTNAAYNDNRVLHEYNNEIIKKLINEPSVESWSAIVEQYEEVVIVIENSENDVVTRSKGRSWTALDVKVQTPFQYKGNAYLIKSSVYLLRDYITDVRVLVEFVFMEFLIGLSALSVLVLIIYTILLRPYKVIYNAIEEYDKTGKFKKVKIRGYAGQVYRRFASVTESLTRQQNNERRIIASISHDIKTPLTSIMGYTERLKNEGISPERKEKYLDTVYLKSREIHQLVDEFDEYLSYNMIKELRTESVRVSDIASSLRQDYADELENEGVVFEVKNSCSESTKISVDSQKLNRVFSNIITNSLKHFDKQEKVITVDFYTDRKMLRIDFSDNGEGVDDDKYEIIFEPLYTSDKGRKVAGLGLANCREIIAAHDGRIYAEKSELGGLKICIEILRVTK